MSDSGDAQSYPRGAMKVRSWENRTFLPIAEIGDS